MSEMRECPHCHWQISQDVEICPQCHIRVDAPVLMNKKKVERGIKKVSKEDVGKAVDKSTEALDLAKKLQKRGGRFGKLFNRVEALVSLIKDYWRKKYREVPWTVIAAAVFAVIYFVNPMDAIPDFIPVVGWIDDVVVILIVLASIEHELRKYLQWKGINPEEVFGPPIDRLFEPFLRNRTG